MEELGDLVYTLRMAPLKFGIGATREVGFELKRMGVKKVLIVTDKDLNEKTEIPTKIKEIVEAGGIEAHIWDGVEPEPTRDVMEAGIKFAKEKQFDGFVALGGGSSIDVAKVIDLFVTYPADFYDYIPAPVGKGIPVPGPLKPLIAIPTTAGTGSETTGVAVVDLPELKLKTGFSSIHLLPTLAIIEPLNTLTGPPSVTASTGVDALMHAIESYIAMPYWLRPRPESPDKRAVYTGSNPVTDALAEKAIELIGKYIRRAVWKGNDIEAREKMALAAFIAGVAFGNAGVHVPHAMAYPVGGRVHVPHGIATGIFGPAFLEYVAPIIPEKVSRVAKLLGEGMSGLSPVEGALKASEALIKIFRDIKFPNGMGAIGLSEDDVPEMARDCLKNQRLLAVSPINVTEDSIAELYKKSLRYW